MPMLRSLTIMMASLALPASAADVPKSMPLASLEWLPYVGTTLPQQGLSAAIVTEAAKQSGHHARIGFFEWSVAVDKVEKGNEYLGYFPAYKSEQRVKDCYLSAPMGSNVVGLATLKDTPLEWKTLADLNKVTIGVVDGYVNGAPFDAMVKQGQQRVEAVPSDTFNLRKLVGKRVRAIVIDREILRYLLADSPARETVVFDPRPLTEMTLHVCFKRSPAGQQMQQAFDAGLQKMDVPKFTANYMKLLDKK